MFTPGNIPKKDGSVITGGGQNRAVTHGNRAIGSADAHRVAHGFLPDPAIATRGACPRHMAKSGL